MRKKYIILGFITFIICSILYYFFYWIKTPIYTINLIRESINNHDILKFEKHVDMDRIFSKAYNDSAVAIDKIEGGTVLTSPEGLVFIEIRKPQSLEALKKETIEIVRGITVAKQEDRTDAERYVFNIRERLDILDTKNIEVRNVSLVSETSDYTLTNINFFNRHLDKDFNITVKMEKLNDGTWKIIEIYNLVDLFIETDKQYQFKLDEINKPIIDKLNKSIKVVSNDVKLKHSFDSYYDLIFNVCFENTTQNDIKDFYYIIYITDTTTKKRDELKFNNYDASVLKSKGTVSISDSKFLKPYVESDIDIMDNFKNKRFDIVIDAIEYCNGEKIETLFSLPK